MGNCGDCSNCLTNFDEVDVTDICKDIVWCIMESGQRYGMNVISGILRGERKAKLAAYGVNHYSAYGKRADVSEGRLKQIINHLVLEEYIYLTKDKYSLVKLNSKAKKIIEEARQIVIKCTEEVEVIRTAPNSTKQRKSDILTSKGLDLFDRLRELRMMVAKEEHVPPYIIFSDKTLVDLCVKLPHNKQEMLQVSGVGENKYERYGEKFIAGIQEVTQGVKEKYYYEPVGETKSSSLRVDNLARPKKKEEFALTQNMADQIIFSEKMVLSDLVNQINELRDDRVMKRSTVAGIVKRLMEEDYIGERYMGGWLQKVVLEKGSQLGISEEIKLSKGGNEYPVLYYSQEAQRFVVDKLLGKWRENDAVDE